MRIVPSLILACAILGGALILKPIPCEPPSVIIETPEPPLADPFVPRVSQPLTAPGDERLIKRVVDSRLEAHFREATEQLKNPKAGAGGPVVTALVAFIMEAVKNGIVSFLRDQFWEAVKVRWMPIAGLLLAPVVLAGVAGHVAGKRAGRAAK